MRLSFPAALGLSLLVAGAGLALAQPPPPPPGGAPGGNTLPPPKQKQAADAQDDRAARPPQRRLAAQLPMMGEAQMPEMTAATEEPVTASGNIELWRARIAERRARQETGAVAASDTPR